MCIHLRWQDLLFKSSPTFLMLQSYKDMLWSSWSKFNCSVMPQVVLVALYIHSHIKSGCVAVKRKSIVAKWVTEIIIHASILDGTECIRFWLGLDLEFTSAASYWPAGVSEPRVLLLGEAIGAAALDGALAHTTFSEFQGISFPQQISTFFLFSHR